MSPSLFKSFGAAIMIMAFDALGVAARAAGYVNRNRIKSLLALVAATALLSAATGILDKFVFMFLISAELALAFFVGEWEMKKVGFELVTLISVLAGFMYGPAVGAAMAAMMIVLHFVVSRSLGPYVVYCVPTMVAVGAAAGYAHAWFPAAGVAAVGIVLSALYNVVTGGLGSILSGSPFEDLTWSGTDFLLNYVLFTAVAPALVTAML